jgi:SAM-dependent methyltransferase
MRERDLTDPLPLDPPGPDGFFDVAVAATYDDPVDDPEAAAEVAATVERLAALAGDGPALEFAIGTGRIAVPLAARGVQVAGIERSRAMVDRLRSKPGGADIPVAIGDMTTTRVEGSFALVYLVFNTIMNVTTQAGQVDVFRNAAVHLRPGGTFLVEVMVPELQRLAPGERFRAYDVTPSAWSIDEYDVPRQGLISHHHELIDGRHEVVSIPFRYVWPAELDLMARLAGLRLRDRRGGWSDEPFTSTSARHVSVWERPAD